MLNNCIETEGLSKHFKNHVLFEDLNFTMSTGDIVGIIGENGCGKSVFLKMLCGLIKQDSGIIRVNDSLIENGTLPNEIGVILDCAGFLPNETGFDNLWTLARIKKKVNKDQVKEVMRQVGLDPFLKLKTSKYSLGMKQRLAIAQAIMEYPTLLILDEPFNAIDSDTVADFIKLFKRLNEDNNLSILMTSHHKDEIESLCKKIYRVENRNLILQ